MRIEPPRLAESRPECGRRWGSTRGRYRFLTLVVAVLAVFPTVESATAQEAQQLRSLRHLGVGNISFLNTWDPSLHAGYLFQLSLRKNQLETGEFGESVVLPPHLYLHTLVSAGWATGAGDAGGGSFAGVGQVGLLWRLDEEGPLGVNALGPVAQASWGPGGIGGGGRAELFHGNLGISVTLMSFDGPRGGGVAVSIDLLRCILQDLGLVQRCVVE